MNCLNHTKSTNDTNLRINTNKKLRVFVAICRLVSFVYWYTFMKTNKSFQKRLKVTKNGKIIGRRPGQNHFNAKESGRSQMGKNRTVSFNFDNKTRSRFLAN
ncbi:MAG: 50S ribosomal protein L35 [Parcubacteria group bacterium GW2011_GWA2_47_21]|nr:MAG: 50S ribosomal protein L35 [Parcubacteria group bacterium GW2011_GWA2_47_21]